MSTFNVANAIDGFRSGRSVAGRVRSTQTDFVPWDSDTLQVNEVSTLDYGWMVLRSFDVDGMPIGKIYARRTNGSWDH